MNKYGNMKDVPKVLLQRVGLSELAKEHGYELIPTGEPLGGTLCLSVAYCLQECALVKDL